MSPFFSPHPGSGLRQAPGPCGDPPRSDAARPGPRNAELFGGSSMNARMAVLSTLTAWCWIESMLPPQVPPAAVGPLPDARQILLKARQAAEALPAEGFDDAYYRAELFRDIAISSARAGDVETSAQLAARLLQHREFALPWKIDCDVEVAWAHAYGGDRAAAAEALRRAAEATADLENPGRRVDALVRIATAQERIGQHDEAAATIRRAVAAAEPIPFVLRRGTTVAGQNKALALDVIALAQRGAGDRDGSEATWRVALAAAEAIEDEIERAGTLVVMATERAKAGEMPGAFRLLDDWPARFGRRADPALGHALAIIAQLQGERGDRE